MIQVINRGLDILELIAKDPERAVSLTEIADTLGLNHATCANIIKTFVNRGYIEQIGHKKGYRLGPKTYSITGNFSYKRDLVLAAKDILQDLTQKVNENTLLAVIKENRRLVVYDVAADQDLQVRTSPDKPLYESATGRLLLAYLTDLELETFAQKYGLPEKEIWEEAVTLHGFKTALAKIRKDGIAIQVTTRHIVGIAVPVSKNDKVIASLGLFLPETRFVGNTKKSIVADIKAAAAQLNKKLAT